MNFGKLLFHAVLFYAFIPGVLVRLPPGGSTLTVNLTHALLFAVVCSLVWKLVFKTK
jgi:hypothetical protein|uniref:Uncharacterized protein n=1 Tax=viral metagenome TaxID=1070528 RepID=A0A6C0JIM1_9ZZZZ